jgi:hypothetical protein
MAGSSARIAARAGRKRSGERSGCRRRAGYSRVIPQKRANIAMSGSQNAEKPDAEASPRDPRIAKRNTDVTSNMKPHARNSGAIRSAAIDAPNHTPVQGASSVRGCSLRLVPAKNTDATGQKRKIAAECGRIRRLKWGQNLTWKAA